MMLNLLIPRLTSIINLFLFPSEVAFIWVSKTSVTREGNIGGGGGGSGGNKSKRSSLRQRWWLEKWCMKGRLGSSRIVSLCSKDKAVSLAMCMAAISLSAIISLLTSASKALRRAISDAIISSLICAFSNSRWTWSGRLRLKSNLGLGRNAWPDK